MGDQRQRHSAEAEGERMRAGQRAPADPAAAEEALARPPSLAEPLAAGEGGIERLIDPRYQPVQRQELAARLHQVGGNRRLAALVARARAVRSPAQRTPTGPAALATTPAAAISPLGPPEMAQFNTLLAGGNPVALLDYVKDVMVRRGEVDGALLATQALPDHRCADCQGASLFVIDSGVNGANAVQCGGLGTAANPLPNPRIRVNFGSLQTQAVTTPHPGQTFQDYLAAIIHSTLRHEFRHVEQERAQLLASGARESGTCTDCNSPAEMDAYLSEIEAGYNPHVYRHAWVRVYTNWGYLAASQQAVFSARRTAAQAKVERAFPGVDWDAEPDVADARRHCREIDRSAGGNTRGRCSNPLAPAPAPAPAASETAEPAG